MRASQAAAGGRWVTVGPQRLEGWLARFAQSHGDTTWMADATTVTVTAADGSVAQCHVPFPPLPPLATDSDVRYAGLLSHASTDRRVGVLLVRLGGHACGVFDGATLLSSKVGTRHVQGRTAAGGQSQQRFARRRQGQARVALQAAADVAVRILVPEAPSLNALVVGGSRKAVDTVMADPRLAALRPLVVEPLLDVPDPRLRVLKGTPEKFRAVRIRIVDPPQVNDG